MILSIKFLEDFKIKLLVFILFTHTSLYAQTKCDSIFEASSLSHLHVGYFYFDAPPKLLDGKKYLYIKNSITKGEVYVSVIIDQNGKVMCTKVIKSYNNSLDFSALEKSKKFVFIPAKANGKNVLSDMVLKITFQ